MLFIGIKQYKLFIMKTVVPSQFVESTI